MANRSNGIVVTTHKATYIPPTLNPGYGGFLPELRHQYGETYGRGTCKNFYSQRARRLHLVPPMVNFFRNIRSFLIKFKIILEMIYPISKYHPRQNHPQPRFHEKRALQCYPGRTNYPSCLRTRCSSVLVFFRTLTNYLISIRRFESLSFF